MRIKSKGPTAATSSPQRRRWVAGNAIWYKAPKAPLADRGLGLEFRARLHKTFPRSGCRKWKISNDGGLSRFIGSILNFRALRFLSPDLLLAFGAICSLATILFVCALVYVIRRNNALKRQIRSLTDELAVVQQKYEGEVAWRKAADRANAVKPSGNNVRDNRV